MDAVEKRRKEIEAKRAKLAELRRLREQRQSNNDIVNANAIVEQPTKNLTASRLEDRREVDELVASLLRSERHDQTEQKRAIAVTDSPTVNVPTSKLSSDAATNEARETQTDEPLLPVSESKSALPTTFVTTNVVPTPVKPKKEVVTYTKGTQTQNEAFDSPVDEDEETTETETQEQLIARLRSEIEAELQLKIVEEEAERKRQVEVLQASQLDHENEFPGNIQPHPDQKTQNDTDLSIEKKVTAIDYTRDVQVEETINTGGQLLQTHQFHNEDTENRMITSLSWSPIFPELVLASYSKSQKVGNSLPGLVLIWNIKTPSRPEFSLTCQSEVQRAFFSPYHANVIIGGSYSGQIMVWDIQIKFQPILTTPLTGKGHTYPITGVDLVGTKQSSSIISTSSDGLVCIWSPDLLAQPQESFDLVLQPPNKVEEVTPTAVSHTPSDTSTFLIGAEDSNLYSVNRLNRAGAKAGIDPHIIYKGHNALVTGIDHHRCKGVLDFSDLVLTTSLDWTIKLWRIRPQSIAAITGSSSPVHQEALLEFPRDEAVYDVRWSPTRPGVFASVDGTGMCHVYDLCKNTEIPITFGIPSDGKGHEDELTATLEQDFGKALNKVMWDHEGQRLAVGGVSGRVTIFSVPDSISGKEGSSVESWHALKNRVKALEQS